LLWYHPPASAVTNAVHKGKNNYQFWSYLCHHLILMSPEHSDS
jgi:hypothetical protein